MASDKTKLSPMLTVLARQRQKAEEARHEDQRTTEAQRDRNRLVATGNRLEDLGRDFELEQRDDKEYLQGWVEAMAAYKTVVVELEEKANKLQQTDEKYLEKWTKIVLVEPGMLGRLSQPLAGLTEHNQDAFQMAVDIFKLADTDPNRAAAMLVQIAELPDFAMSVGSWLRRGLRAVVEGYWQEVVPARWKPTPLDAMSTIYWLGDQTYKVGQADPVAVNESEDRILEAFLAHPTLDLKALVRRANMEPGHIKITLSRFRKKWDGLFAEAIYCPGPGGKGKGYRATVIDARPNRQP